MTEQAEVVLTNRLRRQERSLLARRWLLATTPAPEVVAREEERHQRQKLTREEQRRQRALAEVQLKIHAQLAASPLVWAYWVFPHHFREATPPFHAELMAAAMTQRYLAVAAPRGSAKSTLLSFVYPFHGICFRRFRFIVILSNTFTKAAMHLETMKQELKDNVALRNHFAPQPPELVKDAEGDAEWRWLDGFATKVLCKGHDQMGGIRGVKFGAYRPDLMIVDDVEDDKLVENPDLRRELQRFFDEAWVPAGDSQLCQYIVIGTVLHDDSLLAKLIHREEYPEYSKLIYQAHCHIGTAKEASLWPEKWSLDVLRTLAADKPLVYAKEYQNDPVTGRALHFQAEDFRRWEQKEGEYWCFDTQGNIVARGALTDCQAAIACDLAWETKRSSDYSVLLPALLTPQRDLLVAPYLCQKGLRPNALEEALFEMVKRWEALTAATVLIGLEKAKLEKVMRWFLGEAMRQRNQFLVLRDLLWDADKVQRITTRLSARYSQHSVYHQQGMGELETQLLRFPSGAHDDLPDALQGAVQLLQYPKALQRPTERDDPFMRLRALTIRQRQPTGHGLYQLGHQSRGFQGVSAQIAWLDVVRK